VGANRRRDQPLSSWQPDDCCGGCAWSAHRHRSGGGGEHADPTLLPQVHSHDGDAV